MQKLIKKFIVSSHWNILIPKEQKKFTISSQVSIKIDFKFPKIHFYFFPKKYFQQHQQKRFQDANKNETKINNEKQFQYREKDKQFKKQSSLNSLTNYAVNNNNFIKTNNVTISSVKDKKYTPFFKHKSQQVLKRKFFFQQSLQPNESFQHKQKQKIQKIMSKKSNELKKSSINIYQNKETKCREQNKEKCAKVVSKKTNEKNEVPNINLTTKYKPVKSPRQTDLWAIKEDPEEQFQFQGSKCQPLVCLTQRSSQEHSSFRAKIKLQQFKCQYLSMKKKFQQRENQNQNQHKQKNSNSYQIPQNNTPKKRQFFKQINPLIIDR